MYWRRSSAWIREETSCASERIEITCPASSRSAELCHSTQITEPSLR
jgi:hypothetical protein